MKLNWSSHTKPIIALSPMADMTDSAFCRTVKEVTEIPSYPIMFREMVSSEAVVRENSKTLQMTAIYPSERPLIQQIFGSDPQIMAKSAEIIEREHQPDGFDINMGCPVYKITSNFNGCALMKEPCLAAEIIREMKKVITVPLSVKIRLGWENPTDCIEFAKVIEDAGADLITVHGRTKVQGYSGKSDWEMIAKVKQAVSIPVLANGDIHTPELAIEALKITKCDGVLIARGGLGNPWIFKQIQTLLSGESYEPVSIEERIRVVKLHLAHHLDQYGEKGIATFRKHLTWYFKSIPNIKPYREKMNQTMDRADLIRIFDSIE